MQASDEKPLLCQNSKTCKQLVALVQDILGTKTAMKVLCFGLGELCRTAPEWLKKRHDSWDENSEVKNVMDCMIQHSMALTIAQLCGGNEKLPLVT
jgi:hypothetical protein